MAKESHTHSTPESSPRRGLSPRQVIENWYQGSRLGRRLRGQIADDMRIILDEWFGYDMLVVGADADIAISEMTRVQHITHVVPNGDRLRQNGRNVIALDHELPIATESVDVLVLINALELSQTPHQLLREAHRVLTPHGHLLVVGSNNVSLRGLWHGVLRLFRGAARVPSWGPSASKLEDWLNLLDFAVAPARHKLIVPFAGSGRLGAWLRRIDNALVEHNIPAGAAYVLYANKTVRGHIQPRALERSRARLMGIPVVRPVAGARETLNRDASGQDDAQSPSSSHLRPID